MLIVWCRGRYRAVSVIVNANVIGDTDVDTDAWEVLSISLVSHESCG